MFHYSEPMVYIFFVYSDEFREDAELIMGVFSAFRSVAFLDWEDLSYFHIGDDWVSVNIRET